MKKTFNDVKRMLESKKLLYKAIQKGEEYDIYGIAINGFESEPYHKLVVLRPETTYATYLFEGRISFLLQTQSLDPSVGKGLIEKEVLGGPLQLFVVTDIDAAETAVRDFFSDDKQDFVSAPKKEEAESKSATPKPVPDPEPDPEPKPEPEKEEPQSQKQEDPSFCYIHHRSKVWLKAPGRGGDMGEGRWWCPCCQPK